MTDERAQKYFVVTGGSSGIGLALVKRLVEREDRVTSIARRTCPVSGVESLRWDLADSMMIEKHLSALPENAIPQGLIICHGRGDFGSLEQFSALRVRQLIELHVISTLLVCRHWLPGMKRLGRGNVVFVGSDAALRGAARGTVYCATKFALRGVAQALRDECSGSGVRVGIVNPGMVDTPFYEALDFSPGQYPENALQPSEVADAILFMLSTSSSSVVDEINLSPLKKVIRRTESKR